MPLPLGFPLFPNLPAELRNAVWHFSLPSVISPALVAFKPGCWRVQRNNDELNLVFRHDLLDIPISVPIAQVNREARSIALAWAKDQGYISQGRKEGNDYPIFVKPFDPSVDALYLGRQQLEDLITEADSKIPGQGEVPNGLRFQSIRSPVMNLAFQENWARHEEILHGIRYLINLYMDVRRLLLVVEKGFKYASDGCCKKELVISGGQWGFAEAPGDVYVFKEEYGSFDSEEDFADGVALALLLLENSDEFYYPPGFEIRPVVAVRNE